MNAEADAILEQADGLRLEWRPDDAIALLAPAVERFPEDCALKVSLAMSLHAAGNPNAAIAILLEVILLCDQGGALDGYEEVVAQHSAELLERAVTTR